MGVFGLTINGKHTSEFGLKMTSMYIPMPEPKTNIIDIPYASGNIDLSEVTGIVNYHDREKVEFNFKLYDGNYRKWSVMLSEIAMWIHGKKLKVIVDNDLSFYYVCRLEVDSKKSNMVNSTIVLKGTAEPFKYDIQTSDEDYLWDTFDFETGVIRDNLIDITIDGNNNSLIVYGGGIPEPPKFIVEESNNLALVYGDRTFRMLIPGIYRFPAVKIGQEYVTLHFMGTGKLTIQYRGKYL